jgi:hypothetical protein
MLPAGTLLVLTILGVYWPGRFRVPSGPLPAWDRFDETLARRTRSLVALQDELGAAVREGELLFTACYDLVRKRFVHGAPARPTLFGNWLLALVQLGYPPLALSGADRILASGAIGSCSQISQVLSELGNRMGLPCRLVGLNGHVLVEAWYDEDWHLADPTMELLPRGPRGIYSMEEWSRVPDLVRREVVPLGPERAAKLAADILTRRDNFAMPVGMSYHPNAWVVSLVERSAETLKWAIPALVFGASFLPGKRRPRQEPGVR